MNKNILIGALVVLALAFTVYYMANNMRGIESDDKSASVSTFDGTVWDYQEGTISFEEGGFSANLGCNTLNGRYTIEAGQLSFEAGPTTLMACPEEIAEQELELIANLSAVSGFEMKGETLVLMGDDFEMVLNKPHNAALLGTQWNIISIKEGEGIVSDRADEGTFVIFAPEGALVGVSACNNFNAAYSYELEGATISIENIASTKKMCAPEAMAREQLLLESLTQVEVFDLAGDSLTLGSENGEYQVTFVAQ